LGCSAVLEGGAEAPSRRLYVFRAWFGLEITLCRMEVSLRWIFRESALPTQLPRPRGSDDCEPPGALTFLLAHEEVRLDMDDVACPLADPPLLALLPGGDREVLPSKKCRTAQKMKPKIATNTAISKRANHPVLWPDNAPATPTRARLTAGAAAKS